MMEQLAYASNVIMALVAIAAVLALMHGNRPDPSR